MYLDIYPKYLLYTYKRYDTYVLKIPRTYVLKTKTIKLSNYRDRGDLWVPGGSPGSSAIPGLPAAKACRDPKGQVASPGRQACRDNRGKRAPWGHQDLRDLLAHLECRFVSP